MLRELGIKPNYAELARKYNCDYRTIKKYNEGYEIYGSLFIVLTVLWLPILLSGKIFLSHISSPLMDYLERISMIIYMIHIPTIYILCLPMLSFTFSENQLLVMAILASIVPSIILSKIAARRSKI